MPPNFATACSTAAAICVSSRTSTTMGNARPPACSISAATVWIVPGSFACGVDRSTTIRRTGAVARGAQRDRTADTAARAGDEQRLVA